jgi:precorrin-8X/cobalt-precorrin-8 methylmutase
LLKRYGLPPEEIERLSLELVTARMPALPGLAEDERYVVQRIVRAEGEPDIALSVRFSPRAVERGVEAFRKGAAIIADVRMVEVGTSKALLRDFATSITTLIDSPQIAVSAKAASITRSAAAMQALQASITGAIVAIGNAPTALLALLDMIDSGDSLPALVIGMPVGFVACAESKAELTKRQVDYITIEGFRGGSSAACATLNALMTLAKRER